MIKLKNGETKSKNGALKRVLKTEVTCGDDANTRNLPDIIPYNLTSSNRPHILDVLQVTSPPNGGLLTLEQARVSLRPAKEQLSKKAQSIEQLLLLMISDSFQSSSRLLIACMRTCLSF